MRKGLKEQGITLIALVVTIIVLLILAGVTIGVVTNGTGLFEKAKLATDEYNNKAQQEETELAKVANEIDNHIDSNRENYSQPVFIDSSNKIATIVEDAAYNTNDCTYVATENCAIVGYIFLHNGADVSIYLNDAIIGAVWNDDLGATMTVPIYYLVAKGDTFKIKNNRTAQQYKILYAYGLK